MDKLLELLKAQDKEVLKYIIFLLMKDKYISYEDITSIYVEYLEILRKCADDNYSTLQGKILNMWVDHKKNMRDNLKDIMRYLKDEGRINITDEQINKK